MPATAIPQNYFDSYHVVVYSSRIRDLLAAGVKRSQIRGRRCGWKVYGGGPRAKRFPVTVYEALFPVGIWGDVKAAKSQVAEIEARFVGATNVRVSVRYFCND